MTPQILGARLRRLREQCGLTQLELAEQIGRQFNSEVGRWEDGKVRIPANEVPALAKALGVSIVAFYVDEESWLVRDETRKVPIDLELHQAIRGLALLLSPEAKEKLIAFLQTACGKHAPKLMGSSESMPASS